MKYSVHDIIGRPLLSLTDKRFNHKYVQFVNDVDFNGYVHEGELLATIYIFQGGEDDSPLEKIELKAPHKGYYLFLDIDCFCKRIYDYYPDKPLYEFYEDLGEDIEDDEEHFINSYNALMPELYYYYYIFIELRNTVKKYSSYKCDYRLGFPKDDERPLDFMAPLNWILAKRIGWPAKKTISYLDYLQDIVSRTAYMLCASFMVFPDKKQLLVRNILFDFEEILGWKEDSSCFYEIIYQRTYDDENDIEDDDEIDNDDFDDDETEDDKPLTYGIHKQNQSACYIQHLKKVVGSIVEANQTGDYFNIYLGGLDSDKLSEYSYTFREIMDPNDHWLVNDNTWKLQLTNDFDIAYCDGDNDNVISHYFKEGEVMAKLVRADGYGREIHVSRTGYYHVDVPPVLFPVCFDLPLIYFASKDCIYERNKEQFVRDRTFEYTIKRDRFAKTCTIEWQYDSNLFEIMLPGWYDINIAFHYIENEPTIRVSYRNLYTKRVVKDIYDDNDYFGERFRIYLLLEDDRSFVLDKSRYVETYCNKFGLLVLEYKLDYQLLAALTKNAIAAIRIINQDGETLEREAEPVFFDLFKKYAKQYAEAIKKCDPSIRMDMDGGELPAESACSVYLMHDTTNGFYKIGISNNPEYRERTLQSEKPTIELIVAKEFPVRAIAEAFEAALHKTYASKRIRGEWFDLTGRDVVDLKKALS